MIPIFDIDLVEIMVGRIPDIEIIRLDIHYCRIFSLTLLKLSGRISDNLVFYIKQNLYYPAGYTAKPDIRPNPSKTKFFSCYEYSLLFTYIDKYAFDI